MHMNNNTHDTWDLLRGNNILGNIHPEDGAWSFNLHYSSAWHHLKANSNILIQWNDTHWKCSLRLVSRSHTHTRAIHVILNVWKSLSSLTTMYSHSAFLSDGPSSPLLLHSHLSLHLPLSLWVSEFHWGACRLESPQGEHFIICGQSVTTNTILHTQVSLCICLLSACIGPAGPGCLYTHSRSHTQRGKTDNTDFSSY